MSGSLPTICRPVDIVRPWRTASSRSSAAVLARGLHRRDRRRCCGARATRRPVSTRSSRAAARRGARSTSTSRAASRSSRRPRWSTPASSSRGAIAAVLSRSEDPAAGLARLIDALALALEASRYRDGCPIATVALEAAGESEPIRRAAAARVRLVARQRSRRAAPRPASIATPPRAARCSCLARSRARSSLPARDATLRRCTPCATSSSFCAAEGIRWVLCDSAADRLQAMRR